MNWENPYIAKLSELETIVAAQSNSISSEDCERLRSLVAPYTKVYLEFGSGSGAHLIERAASDPDSAYVGFELRFKRAFRTAEKVATQTS